MGLLKLEVTLAHSHILSHDLPSSPYLLPYAWKRKRGGKRRKRERERERNSGNTGISKVLLPLPPRAKAEQDWTPSTITPGHLQKLMKQWFMMAAELTAFHVLEDPVFPAPTEGYVVSFMAFYERWFGMPSHYFLCSLLQYYDLELHHLNPSGVLHIAAFITLCEAYLGVDPKFDLWNYFFRVRRPQDPKMELMVSRGTVIHLKSRHGVDPYLNITMLRLMKGWRKKWFYLRNDTSASLPMFTGSRPVPLPSCGGGVAWKHLCRL
jgi:hypothetical protein